MAKKKKRFKIGNELDMKLLGIELCHHREEVAKMSKRRLHEEYNINAHTVNAIESGKSVRIQQLLHYCDVLNFEMIVTVEEK